MPLWLVDGTFEVEVSTTIEAPTAEAARAIFEDISPIVYANETVGVNDSDATVTSYYGQLNVEDVQPLD